MPTPSAPILLMVRLKSSLPMEELETRYRKRMPEFRALPGLLQKYYLRDPASGELAGLYLWDSQESLDAYLDSELCKTIGKSYEAVGPPTIETLAVMDTLRP